MTPVLCSAVAPPAQARLAEQTQAALRELLRAALHAAPQLPAPTDLPRLRDALVARLLAVAFHHAGGRDLDATRLDLAPLDPTTRARVRELLPTIKTPEQLGALYESTIALTLARTGDSLHFIDSPAERRRSGAHYTPQDLTTSIVDTALQPVLTALGERPTPAQILDIKLCDPAMGAGAFLVAACRQLADHLVRAHAAHRLPLPADPHLLVARNNLHGVDRDPLAVTAAGLALALLTGADDPLPALRHGDSLVGLPGPDGLADVLDFFAADAARGRLVLPFHWPHEYPHVFTRHNPGFDCIVGNPPFLGGKRISTVLGPRTRDWLARLHGPGTGNADLAAHFLRRGFALLRDGGALGFIATNTITQGDTLRAGLSHLCRHGTIYAARTRVPWPGAAAVMACIVHIVRGPHPAPILDDVPVARISAFLLPTGGDATPAPLPDNRNTSFTGCDLKGAGFTFDDNTANATPLSVMHELLKADPRNAEIIRPYIGGEEINTHPHQSPHRHVIHFADRPLAEAAAWPALLKILEEKVAPKRRAMAPELARWPWWQFWRTRARLRAATADLPRVLVNCQVTAHLAFVFMPTDLVFAHTVNIFAFADDAVFAVLQSRVHEVWARMFASSLEDRLRYTPSDCFETFPLPPAWRTDRELAELGRRYHAAREDLMHRRELGLTTLYNHFHDPTDTSPDIAILRQHHDALDRAVLRAYGWPDLAAQATSEFSREGPSSRSRRDPAVRRPRLRWPQSLTHAVLTRLLALHAARSRPPSPP